MEDIPRKKLVEIVGRYGQGLATDPRRCEALLRDVCPAHKREIFILVCAVKDSVPRDLLGSSSGTPKQVLISRLSRRLHDNLGVAEDLAQWAVECWAVALGIAEHEDLQGRSPSPAAPQPEEIFRQAIRRVLVRGVIPPTKRAYIKNLRAELGISHNAANRVLAAVCAELNPKQATRATAPAAAAPPPVIPRSSRRQTGKPSAPPTPLPAVQTTRRTQSRKPAGFGNWYGTRFGRMPIVVQCLLWLFYGWIWIPVAYLVSRYFGKHS